MGCSPSLPAGRVFGGKYKMKFKVAAALLILTLITAISFAGDDNLIPRELLFDNPELGVPLISPDGTMLVYTAPYKGSMNIWVRKISEKKGRVLTQFKDKQLKPFWGMDNEHILFQYTNNRNEIHLYVIDLKKKNPKPENLTPFKNVIVRIIGKCYKRPFEYIITMNRDNPKLEDMYLLDIRDGNIQMLQKNPGNVIIWLVGPNLELMGVVTTLPGGREALLLKDSKTGSWEQIHDWGNDDFFKIYYFNKSGTKLYVTHNLDSNFVSLYEINVNSREEKLLFKPKRSDIYQIAWDNRKIYPLAVSEFMTQPDWHILDSDIEQTIKNISRKLGSNFSFLNTDFEQRKIIVQGISKDSPRSFYIYHTGSGKLEYLYSLRAGLKKYKLAETNPVTIKTRDGYNMVSYLTIPVGKKEKNLPLIIMPNIGIDARFWGYFDSISQFLSNRGYAVLQINHRGTAGFGKDFLAAGNKEWGDKMVEDIIDSATWAIKEGIADRKKIGLLGFYFGGLNTMMATTKRDVKFRCNVTFNPFVNLISFFKNMPPQWQKYDYWFNSKFGDPTSEYVMLKKHSPYYNSIYIKTPTMIGAGEKYNLLSTKELYYFSKKLRKHRVPVMYLEYANEASGFFTNSTNQMSFFAMTEMFFAKYLGGRYQKFSGKEKQAIKKALKVNKD